MSSTNPDHYKVADKETIDTIDAAVLNPASHWHACAIKYLCRAIHKGEYVADLEKAQWYLGRLLDHEHSNGDVPYRDLPKVRDPAKSGDGIK